MAKTHYFPSDEVHFTWDAGNAPVLTVDSGDTVVVHTRDVSDNQIGPDSTVDVIAGLDWDRVYPLAGPIAVDGAQPGDTLAIEVLDLHTQGWGWTAILPGLGLLADDFPDAVPADLRPHRGRRRPTCARTSRSRSSRSWARWASARRAPARSRSCRPGSFGGNMDTRQLTRGTTLYLPVQVDGALFSCGDAHGAQGDGEVCVTGLESPMYGALRFTLHKDRPIPAPQYLTGGPLAPRVADGPWYGTTGVGPDLYVGAQEAVRAMVDHLADRARPLARGRLPALQPVRRPAHLGDRRRRRVRGQRAAAVADLRRRVGLPGERRRTARAGRGAARRRGRPAHPARLRGQGAP